MDVFTKVIAGPRDLLKDKTLHGYLNLFEWIIRRDISHKEQTKQEMTKYGQHFRYKFTDYTASWYY